MPIDSGLYSKFAPQVRSVADYEGEAQNQQINALALMGARQKQDEYGRGLQEQQTVRNALQQLGAGATDDQRLGAMYGTGTQLGYSQGDAFRKTLIEQQKATAEAGKVKAQTAETNAKLFKQYAGVLVQSPTMDTVNSVLAHYEQATGDKADNIRAILQQAGGNPEVIKRIGAALSMEAEKLLPKVQTTDYGGFKRPEAVDPLTGRVTATGVDVRETQSPDSVATAGTAAARLKFDREQAGNVPLTYETDANGNFVALPTRTTAGALIRPQAVAAPGGGLTPLKGKETPLNEGQEKSLMFGSKMAESGKVIAELEKGGTTNRGYTKAAAQTAGRVMGLGTDGMGGTLADIAGTATNWTQSPEQQRYEAAKMSWIAGQLRKESGAVIGPSEYRDADNQYFPQPNDDAATIADKARRRATAEATMMQGVPQARRPKADAPTMPPPKPGAVLKFDANGNLQ